MFKRLQEKWGVSTRQFWILFIVFGLTGTTTAILTRYITAWLGMDASTFWGWKVLLRIGMLVFGYQFILLGYGALLGQWAFFWKYEKKLLRKLGVWSLESEVKAAHSSLLTPPDSRLKRSQSSLPAQVPMLKRSSSSKRPSFHKSCAGRLQ
jgi:hypothetical protein